MMLGASSSGRPEPNVDRREPSMALRTGESGGTAVELTSSWSDETRVVEPRYIPGFGGGRFLTLTFVEVLSFFGNFCETSDGPSSADDSDITVEGYCASNRASAANDAVVDDVEDATSTKGVRFDDRKAWHSQPIRRIHMPAPMDDSARSAMSTCYQHHQSPPKCLDGSYISLRCSG